MYSKLEKQNNVTFSKAKQLKEKELKVKEKDQLVNELKTAIEEREYLLNEKDDELHKKDEKISQLINHLNQQKQDLIDTKNELLLNKKERDEKINDYQELKTQLYDKLVKREKEIQKAKVDKFNNSRLGEIEDFIDSLPYRTKPKPATNVIKKPTSKSYSPQRYPKYSPKSKRRHVSYPKNLQKRTISSPKSIISEIMKRNDSE
jgi:DNA repair exonuclease SbcCD ATPase subunit